MVLTGVKETVSGAASTAGKSAAGVGGVLGLSDLAEGNGFDKASAALGEVVNGLNIAFQKAGGVLNDVLGLIPWRSSGQEVAGAAQGMVVDAMVVIL